MELDEYRSHANSLIDKIIADVIPKEETEFIKAIKEFIVIPDIIEDNYQYTIVKFSKELFDRLPAIITKYPFLNSMRYANLFIEFYRTLTVYMLNEDRDDPETMILVNSEMIDAFHNIAHIKPSLNLLNVAAQDLKFFEREIEKNKRLLNNPIVANTNKPITNTSLFNINIGILEDQLIKERLLLTTDKQLVKLLTVEWSNCEFIINWEGRQSALLYLLYLINNNNTFIVNGTIATLITKNFTINKEKVELRNITKAISKMVKTYITDGYSKPEFLLQIDRVLHNTKLLQSSTVA